MNDIVETNDGGFPVKNANYWRRQAINKDKEIESLRQRVKELEELRICADHDANNLAKELAALKQSQGEPATTVMRNKSGQIFMAKMDGNSFDMSEYVGKTLYTAPTIPEGWQLVPKKLTLKMLIAAKEVWFTTDYFPKALQDSYEAALAAAPKLENK